MIGLRCESAIRTIRDSNGSTRGAGSFEFLGNTALGTVGERRKTRGSSASGPSTQVGGDGQMGACAGRLGSE